MQFRHYHCRRGMYMSIFFVGRQMANSITSSVANNTEWICCRMDYNLQIYIVLRQVYCITSQTQQWWTKRRENVKIK